MADRPILFSAPMIRALLEGRKTQTRRLIKPQPSQGSNGAWHIQGCGGGCFLVANATDEEIAREQADYVPYAVDDRLWVREAWAVPSGLDAFPPREIPSAITDFWYLADGGYSGYGKRRPGIFMPRWASRLTLTVTDVSVQRLQEISREDVIAEGITERDGYPIADVVAGWHEPYAELWDKLNGAGAWDANPWVVALTFTVERRNIDETAPAFDAWRAPVKVDEVG